MLPLTGMADSVGTEVSVFRLERSADSIYLTAHVRFDLPGVVEDALYKGVPVYFVAHADVVRERWYWMDKKVASVTRYMRLVYLPLTRRWRMGVSSELTAAGGQDVVLGQNYDSLREALAAVRRMGNWRLTDVSEIDPAYKHRVDFEFRLDVTQLPRPLQIGTLGQRDWLIETKTHQLLALESLR